MQNYFSNIKLKIVRLIDLRSKENLYSIFFNICIDKADILISTY